MSTARRLGDLLEDVRATAVRGDLDRPILGITHDSRRAGPGILFVAYRGVTRDVHQFLPDAADRGAEACLVERPLDELEAIGLASPGPTYIEVPDARLARAQMAAALYRFPARGMALVGVTGTDGKTTTCLLLHSMVRAGGVPVGVVTTVGAQIGDGRRDTGLHVTTPDPEDLQLHLRQMADAGVEVAIVEATSHGLAQHRLGAIDFDIGVVTNITPEALEYHGTFDAYVAAKATLIERLEAGRVLPGVSKTAILNRDDPSFERLAAIPVARRLTFGRASDCDFRLVAVRTSARGLAVDASTPAGDMTLETPLVGAFNGPNVLAAAAAASALGLGPDAWLAGALAVERVPGRMELVDAGQQFIAIVDFAHTPNGLDSALQAARDLALPDGRLLVVCGCAGLRDPGKRSAMGRVAVERADLSVFTAEDPRTEDPQMILAAMADGARESGGRDHQDFELVVDRMAAIELAIGRAMPGDVVIVCGKGHEQSMAFGAEEFPWDDRAAVRAAIRGEGYQMLPTSAP